MFYVYILRSLKDNKIYTGYTSNLKLRLSEHLEGKVKSTSFRRPLKLVYYEAYLSKKDAQDRERYLKGGGKAKLDLKKQIENTLKI
ncbi:MAG TPA: GIY-YIG nuclease family protein [Patescibacteria group bacterium]|nr:GIY-YIG nuclease family protein [Patescibacteria group bacterium]